MYLRIEKEFKKRSKHRKTQLRFVVGAFAFATILSLLFSSDLFAMIENNKIDVNYIWFTLLGMLPFFVICHIYMAVSYNKLWKLLIDKGMTKTELRLQTDMSTATLAKMSKNEVVSMDVMLRICKVLDCNVGDIMDATKE